MTAWLSGMLAVASIMMCLGLWPLIKLELKTSNIPWYKNKAFRLAAALYIHGLGAIILFASPFFSSVKEPAGLSLWLVWATFTTWLIAKTMIISVSGWFRTCLIIYAAWTSFCIFAVTNNWWS